MQNLGNLVVQTAQNEFNDKLKQLGHWALPSRVYNLLPRLIPSYWVFACGHTDATDGMYAIPYKKGNITHADQSVFIKTAMQLQVAIFTYHKTKHGMKNVKFNAIKSQIKLLNKLFKGFGNYEQACKMLYAIANWEYSEFAQPIEPIKQGDWLG